MYASGGVFVNVESSAFLIYKIINPKCSKMKKFFEHEHMKPQEENATSDLM